MTDSVQDLRDTIVPKSDQLNADDLLGGAITVQVTAVRRGDRDQPVAVHVDGGHQPYKPCKSMRRVLISAWGNDGGAWVGRSMTLVRDAEVVFGGVKVGGVRISHLSHIDGRLTLPLMVTRGQRKPYTVEPLVASKTATTAPAPSTTAQTKASPADYLRKHPDPDLVAQIRKGLFADKSPLNPAEIQRLADAVKKQEPPPATGAREPGDDTGMA